MDDGGKNLFPRLSPLEAKVSSISDQDKLLAAATIDRGVDGGRMVIDGVTYFGSSPGIKGIKQPTWFPTILAGPGCLAIAALEAAGYQIIPPKCR